MIAPLPSPRDSWNTLHKRLYESVNYRLRDFGGGRWASACRPVSIVFLLTELCNARCVHCDIWKNKGREDSPSPDQLKKTLSEMREWLGPVQVVFSGGESLMRPYTPEVAAHASAIGLFLEVLTHGYWAEQSRIEKLGLANPWRITISFDGMGSTHDRIRGRQGFWDKTITSLENLRRLRRDHGLRYSIRLKTVVMEHNLDDLAEVARFAASNEMEVFYQAIEQNYNTENDPRWFEHTDNWPKDSERAVTKIEELIRLRSEGLPIVNSEAQLRVMIPYFRNPMPLQVAIQSHSAHEKRTNCSALINMQIQANGDVRACLNSPPIGNIRHTPIRQIWERRPRNWETGCCLQRAAAEQLVSVEQIREQIGR